MNDLVFCGKCLYKRSSWNDIQMRCDICVHPCNTIKEMTGYYRDAICERISAPVQHEMCYVANKNNDCPFFRPAYGWRKIVNWLVSTLE